MSDGFLGDNAERLITYLLLSHTHDAQAGKACVMILTVHGCHNHRTQANVQGWAGSMQVWGQSLGSIGHLMFPHYLLCWLDAVTILAHLKGQAFEASMMETVR